LLLLLKSLLLLLLDVKDCCCCFRIKAVGKNQNNAVHGGISISLFC
jgi:hypothetical protein